VWGLVLEFFMPEGGWRKEKVNGREIFFLIQDFRFAIYGGNVISSLLPDQRAKTEFSKFLNKTGVSSGKTS
jgi:hypothetical protein